MRPTVVVSSAFVDDQLVDSRVRGTVFNSVINISTRVT